MMQARETELLAAVALTDGGISLPLRTVLRNKPFRLTMKMPTTRSLIRISRLYLEIGVSPKELDSYDLDQTARFVLLHGKRVSRIVAAGIVRGPLMGRILNRPVAWLLRETMHPVALTEAWKQILTGLSTTSFGNIIASAAAINKMQPMMTSRPGSESGQRS